MLKASRLRSTSRSVQEPADTSPVGSRTTAACSSLRIVLIENLRRSAEQIASGRAARQEADALADRLLGVGGRAAEAPETALRRFDSMPLPTAFVVQLLQRLRDQDPRVTPALVWLD